MVVHLCLVALLMVCYHHMHEFGSLIAPETLEAEIVLAVVEVFHHVPCHWWAAFSCKRHFEWQSILLTLVSEPKIVFLGSLISVLATFKNGMTNSCGCLLLMSCNTSKGMTPVGNSLSKLISNMLLVFKLSWCLYRNPCD